VYSLTPARVIVYAAAMLVGALAVLSVLAISVLPGQLGMATYVVRSGSMEPAIHTGSIIFAREVDPRTLRVGDVVVYNLPHTGESVTHRVIEVEDDGSQPRFITKGDANGAPDDWTVQYNGAAGKVVFSLQLAGYFWRYVNTPQGKLLFLVTPTAVLAAIWLIRIWRPEDSGRDTAQAASTRAF
jgi:signal peptidase